MSIFTNHGVYCPDAQEDPEVRKARLEQIPILTKYFDIECTNSAYETNISDSLSLKSGLGVIKLAATTSGQVTSFRITPFWDSGSNVWSTVYTDDNYIFTASTEKADIIIIGGKAVTNGVMVSVLKGKFADTEKTDTDIYVCTSLQNIFGTQSYVTPKYSYLYSMQFTDKTETMDKAFTNQSYNYSDGYILTPISVFGTVAGSGYFIGGGKQEPVKGLFKMGDRYFWTIGYNCAVEVTELMSE